MRVEGGRINFPMGKLNAPIAHLLAPRFVSASLKGIKTDGSRILKSVLKMWVQDEIEIRKKEKTGTERSVEKENYVVRDTEV